jgi:dynein heavy chain
LVVNK